MQYAKLLVLKSPNLLCSCDAYRFMGRGNRRAEPVFAKAHSGACMPHRHVGSLGIWSSPHLICIHGLHLLTFLPSRHAPCPQTLQQAKVQFNPDVIVISALSDSTFHEACKLPVEGCERPGNVSVRYERAAAFKADKALQILSLLQVRSLPPTNGLVNHSKHLQLLSTLVDLSKPQQLAALGALLAVLQKEGVMYSNEGLAPDDDLGPGESDGHAGFVVDQLAEINLKGWVESLQFEIEYNGTCLSLPHRASACAAVW